MPRRRDRHGRGIRGPLAAPGSPAKLAGRASRGEFFNQCVTDAMAQVLAHDPAALDGVAIGVEEVPHLTSRWSGDRVPLSAALEGTRGGESTVVLYQRPLEHRAAAPQQLRSLVHRTLVEQLSTLTGRSLEDLGLPLDDD